MNILNVECIHVLGQHVLALEVKIVILFKVYPIPATGTIAGISHLAWNVIWRQLLQFFLAFSYYGLVIACLLRRCWVAGISPVILANGASWQNGKSCLYLKHRLAPWKITETEHTVKQSGLDCDCGKWISDKKDFEIAVTVALMDDQVHRIGYANQARRRAFADLEQFFEPADLLMRDFVWWRNACKT